MSRLERGERIEEDRGYVYRHIDIDIDYSHKKKKKPRERRFYVPDVFEFDFKKMEKILAREGKSLSQWIREQVCSYVRLHEPGNPQQSLDTIFELGRAYRANECLECGKKPFVLASVGKKSKLLCKLHFEKFRPRLTNWRYLEE